MELKKFGFAMPVYPPSEKGLKRAVDSIIDQKDYPDWKLVVCFDGKNEDGEKIMSEYKDLRISYITIDHAGACAARNAATKELLKEPDIAYISAFSSDFVAKPGMLTTWAKAFDDHPDCAFVYGGYEVLNELGNTVGHVPGEPFDAVQLETYNYIDGGFPIRREDYHEWDESIKSLNDWDFWLNIVKAGKKGYYMANVTYAADAPKEGGLSYDSSENWLKRLKTIRAKHGIKEKDICVVSLGAQPHARNLARILDADFHPQPQFKPHNYKMIYLLGCYPQSIDAHAHVFSQDGLKSIKVIHWIGTDVFQIKGLKMDEWGNIRDLVLKKHIDYNLTEYGFTHDEMESYGLKTSIVPFPIKYKETQSELPKEFTVGIYMPHTVNGDSEWKYQMPLMRDVMRACPDIKFTVFGGNVGKERNVEALGWVSPKEFISKISVLMRITLHDGLPVSPIECLLTGRQVITNTPMPYVEFVTPKSEDGMLAINKFNYCEMKEILINRIRKMKQQYGSIKYPWDLIQGYYKNICDIDKFKARIYGLLEKKPIVEDPMVTDYFVNGELVKKGGVENV